MKEEWLFHGAVVPIDVETTAALVAEIKRLIDVIGGMALAQSKQEPVLWMMPDGKTADKWALQFYGGQKGKPLYTTPPQRKPLTDEEIDRLWSQSLADTEGETYLPLREFARAIEAKLKQKNT